MSPRSKEQHDQVRRERMDQIRRAFSEVYLEKGVQGTDIGEVAKRAGVSRTLIYYYFKDKMELIQGMFQEYFDAAKEFVTGCLLTAESPLIRLERYARFYLETAVTKPRRVYLYRNMINDMPIVFGGQSQDYYHSFLDSVHGPLVRTIEEGIAAGQLAEVEPVLLAQTYMGGVTGAMLELAKRQVTADEGHVLVEQAVSLIFRGIVKGTV
ncbi:TetR/AcrR family transcriptional regulator [Paenibacillus sp. PR3]|uniref:TetR/AcrR family transcriptional regulator n=1 Tax=Paenibacillus terricola TaxID=2763503 RepID=A0ABR8N2C3_9BACL|nr:TetR/AcrR family transcriptional regulator [Paenibacillus terricola]MBD3922325.1 TetR/AcrR family transcriptional regulator [Paenibacillus terricola]